MIRGPAPLSHPDTSPSASANADAAAAGNIAALRHYRRAFAGREIISDLDLEIAPGEFIAMIGRSGCGKSTLLRTLAGLDQGGEGEVLAPVSRSVVFQDARLLPWKKVWQNVTLGLRGESPRARAAEVLDEVGLTYRIDAWPLTLSGGEAQRVALARALVGKPELLLLDEPFAALDALTRQQMHELLLSIWRRYRPAVLIVTHDVDEAIALAQRVVVLQQGRIAFEGIVQRDAEGTPVAHGALRAKLLATLNETQAHDLSLNQRGDQLGD